MRFYEDIQVPVVTGAPPATAGFVRIFGFNDSIYGVMDDGSAYDLAFNNVDGGAAASVYLAAGNLDGGSA